MKNYIDMTTIMNTEGPFNNLNSLD